MFVSVSHILILGLVTPHLVNVSLILIMLSGLAREEPGEVWPETRQVRLCRVHREGDSTSLAPQRLRPRRHGQDQGQGDGRSASCLPLMTKLAGNLAYFSHHNNSY